jgi:hypothetical protein
MFLEEREENDFFSPFEKGGWNGLSK